MVKLHVGNSQSGVSDCYDTTNGYFIYAFFHTTGELLL
jgi:hypothetical protein